MNSRRTVILIVAVVVGAIATFGIWNYIKNVEGAVYENAEPENVWMIRRPIPKGMTVEEAVLRDLIFEAEIPADFRPPTAVVDPQTELAGLVAVNELAANSVLVTGFFVAPNVISTGITDRLEEKGMVTVSFSVDQVKGAAYLIEPGDRVNILSVKPLESAALPESEDETSAAEPTDTVDTDVTYDYLSRYVYQAAEVLAIDKSLTPDLGETPADSAAAAGNGGMITLAVPPDAVQLVLAVGAENLYLSLVPSSYEPVPLPPLDYAETLLPGEDGRRLTPYGPDSGEEDIEQAS